MHNRNDLPYRAGVGIMLINNENKVFVAQRLDSMLEAWQMPQGGLDGGEDAEQGALRELEEETGINRANVEIIARCPIEFHYDLPDDLIGKIWGGEYRGQKQIWFLCRFTGSDGDINIDTDEPEFRAWKWANPSDLPSMIVPFKRELYENVLNAFADWL